MTTDVKPLTGHNLKSGDTEPALRAQLLRDDGTPKDLSNFSANISIKNVNEDTLTVDDSVTIEDDLRGIVSYSWQSGETDTGGTYVYEVTIDDGAGTTITFPNRGTETIMIEEHL